MSHPVTPNSMPGAQQTQQQQSAPPAQQQQGTPPTAPAAPAPTPPWGTDPANYDPDKAAHLISTLRASEDKQNATIRSQNVRIADLETQLAHAEPIVQAHTDAQRHEQGEVATLRQDLDAARQETIAAQQLATARLNSALNAKAEALASNRDPNRTGAAFVNPAVAARLIDLTDCLTADGQIDDTAIASKLDALATSDPYLIAQTATGRIRRPNPAQGQGNGALSAVEQQQHAEESGDVKSALLAAATQLAGLTSPPQY